MAEVSFNTSFSDINDGLFGSNATVTSSTDTDTTRDGTSTSQLTVDDEAIFKYIEDSIGGVDGLAAIFGAQNAAGLIKGSQAKDDAGNLYAKIAGEIAKLTGVTTGTQNSTEFIDVDAVNTTEKDGILDNLGLGGLGDDTSDLLTTQSTGGLNVLVGGSSGTGVGSEIKSWF